MNEVIFGHFHRRNFRRKIINKLIIQLGIPFISCRRESQVTVLFVFDTEFHTSFYSRLVNVYKCIHSMAIKFERLNLSRASKARRKAVATRNYLFQNVLSRPFNPEAVFRPLVAIGSERNVRWSGRPFKLSYGACWLRVETFVLGFLVVTSSHGAAGQPREVCGSCSFPVIDWASGTAVS